MNDFFIFAHLGFRHIMDINGSDHMLFILALVIRYMAADWKKIYFNLGSTLALRKSIYYRVIFNITLPEGKENASVHIDNITLISF